MKLHSARGALTAANAEILTVIFYYGNYKGEQSEWLRCYFLFKDDFFFFLDY
jgi:hypothetical protein